MYFTYSCLKYGDINYKENSDQHFFGLNYLIMRTIKTQT